MLSPNYHLRFVVTSLRLFTARRQKRYLTGHDTAKNTVIKYQSKNSNYIEIFYITGLHERQTRDTGHRQISARSENMTVGAICDAILPELPTRKFFRNPSLADSDGVQHLSLENDQCVAKDPKRVEILTVNISDRCSDRQDNVTPLC